MELFKAVDEKATIKAVRTFFLKDDFFHRKSYGRIKRQYNALRSASSPTGDITGISGSFSNRMEDKLLNGVEYTRAIECVSAGIEACSELSQKIIELRYICGEEIWRVKQSIGISGKGSYYRKDDYACYEFADAMDSLVDRYGVRELFPDFIIFASGTKSESLGAD